MAAAKHTSSSCARWSAHAHAGVSVRIARGMFSAAIDATERRVRGGGVALVFASALLLRCVVTTFPHSGQATPPKYGDYEVR